MKIRYSKKLLELLGETNCLSDDFHLSTNNNKLNRAKLTNIPDSWIKINFKSYPRLEKFLLKRIVLKKNSIGKIIWERQSLRNYKNKTLSKTELSYLLYEAAGLKKFGKTIDQSKRPYPSAGARFPLEIYPLIFNCDGFKKGVYHYNVKENCLELILQQDLRKWLLKATAGEWLTKASVIFIITGVFDRIRVKYGDRGYRYILIEVGHLAQNLSLIATELGLQSCPIGGFIDNEVNKLLDIINQKERTLYLIAVGKK